MHKEKAYIETEPFQLISYELTKELNEFVNVPYESITLWWTFFPKKTSLKK